MRLLGSGVADRGYGDLFAYRECGGLTPLFSCTAHRPSASTSLVASSNRSLCLLRPSGSSIRDRRQETIVSPFSASRITYFLLALSNSSLYTCYMKISDDYKAKYTIWANTPQIARPPVPIGIPSFASRKFSSYQEFNEWKRSLRMRIAEQGGLKWKKS